MESLPQTPILEDAPQMPAWAEKHMRKARKMTDQERAEISAYLAAVEVHEQKMAEQGRAFSPDTLSSLVDDGHQALWSGISEGDQGASACPASCKAAAVEQQGGARKRAPFLIFVIL